MKTYAKNGGEECNKNDKKEYKICRIDEDVTECPKKGLAAWCNWGQWSSCHGECGKRGRMTRTRDCLSYNGEGCKGDNKDERKCPNMCPQSKNTF